MRTVIYLLLFCYVQNSFSQITFQKTFGGTGDEKSYCINSAADGGYIVCGSTNSFGTGGQDAIAIRLDACSNVLWNKTYGNSDNEIWHWIEQTTDNGFIAAGTATGINPTNAVLTLTRIDSLGNVQWAKSFDSEPASGVGGIVHQTYDGGFIIMNRNLPNNNFYLIKTDNLGNIVWSNTFFSSLNTKIGGGIAQCPDSGFICTGFTSTPSYGVIAIKVDKNGAFLWSKIYSNNGGINESSYYCEVTGDGGFIYVGESEQTQIGNHDVYIIKADSIGNVQWAKAYGIPGLSLRSFSGSQTTDQGYVATAWSYVGANLEAYLFKTDSIGNPLWSKSYGGSGDEGSWAMCESNDGGYALTGWTSSFGAGGFDIYVLKTDVNGNTECHSRNAGISSLSVNPVVISVSPVLNHSNNIATINYVINNPLIQSSNNCLYTNIQSVCNGETYTINGHTYSTSGTYMDTLQTIAGCDSVVITQLSVVNITTFSQSVASCDQFIWQGNVLTTSGTYYDTLISSSGCDSILILQLTIKNSQTYGFNATVCNSYYWNGNVYTTSGTYYDTLSTASGCDSIVTLSLNVYLNYNESQSVNLCEGDSFIYNGNVYSQHGIYRDTLTTIQGCDSIVTTFITTLQLPVIDAGHDLFTFEGIPVQITATGGNYYLWSTSETIASILVNPSSTANYIVIGYDLNNCSNSDTVTVFIEKPFTFYVPNAFTPNQDGINDTFSGSGTCIDELEMTVFDRWGKIIFASNNQRNKWTGKIQSTDELAPTGVYVYMIEVMDCHGEKHSLIGKVSVIY